MERLTAKRVIELVEKFILDNRIAMLIEMPEGTLEAKLKDNAGLGPTEQLYILLNAISTTAKEMNKIFDGGFDNERLAEAIAELVRKDILDALNEPTKEEESNHD